MSAFSVCLSFDFDAMSVWLASFDKRGPQSISRGEFGARVGVPRILRLLDEFEARATFFTPGFTARTYPNVIRDIARSGHELAGHGDFHETFEDLSVDEERRVLTTSATTLEELSGERPVGFRAPAADMSPNTIELLVELGYLYDSSLMGDDFRPYWCRTGDSWTPSTRYLFGAETRLIELPISYLVDDFAYFEFEFSPPLTGQADPSAVERIWTAQFDYMMDHLHEGTFVLCMHPQTIGHASRIMMLESFMHHARARGAAFERMRDVAGRWTMLLPPPQEAPDGTP